VNEPRWVSREVADAIHHEQIAEHGGSLGVRDEGLLLSALARPRDRWAYDHDADLCAIAAAYAFGLAKNHAYVDGNKRVALHVTYVFLRANHLVLDAPEPEIVAVMLAVADGTLSETALALWLREHVSAA